jgi:hypothetical protein
MNEKRAHDENPSASDRARDGLDALRGRANFFVREHAEAVSSGKNAQRSIVGRRGVKVNA